MTFPSTGTTVTWTVFGGAGGADPNTSSGLATNGYESFWVYRDAGEWLYYIDGWNCYAEYFMI